MRRAPPAPASVQFAEAAASFAYPGAATSERLALCELCQLDGRGEISAHPPRSHFPSLLTRQEKRDRLRNQSHVAGLSQELISANSPGFHFNVAA